MLSWLLGDKINSYALYKERCKNLKGIGSINNISADYFAYNTYSYFNDILSFEDFRKCKNFQSNRSKKRYRCFNNYNTIEIIGKLTNATMVFGTITINNNFLDLNYETQKKAIQRYLKKHFFYCIKNADYGSKNDRLHFHFIGLTFDKFIPINVKSKKGRDMFNILNDKWKWGFLPVYEFIPYQMTDKKKLSNYIVKLNNHSNKVTTKNTRLSILKNKKYLSKYCILSDTIL